MSESSRRRSAEKYRLIEQARKITGLSRPEFRRIHGEGRAACLAIIEAASRPPAPPVVLMVDVPGRSRVGFVLLDGGEPVRVETRRGGDMWRACDEMLARYGFRRADSFHLRYRDGAWCCEAPLEKPVPRRPALRAVAGGREEDGG